MKKKNNNQNNAAMAADAAISAAEENIKDKENDVIGVDNATDVDEEEELMRALAERTEEENQIIAAHYAKIEKKARRMETAKAVGKIVLIALGVTAVGAGTGAVIKAVKKNGKAKDEDPTDYIDIDMPPRLETSANADEHLDIADVEIEDLEETER